MDQDPTRNWEELCEAASKEADPKKLMSLITEIVKVLDDQRRKTARVASVQNFEGSSSSASSLLAGPKGPACENGSSL